MDSQSEHALEALFSDIANTHDFLIRIIANPDSERVIAKLKTMRVLDRNVHLHQHVRYPQLGIEYVLYWDCDRNCQEMAILS